jgi:hypothetical protein
MYAVRPAFSAPPILFHGGLMVGIIIILAILWFLGVITKNTFGGVLHILLVVAVVFLLINVIRGRGV